jgi:glycerol-3-phosphate acyltransferase PlsY
MIVRRAYSIPENLTLLSVGAAVLGAVYPTITEHTGGRGIPCPLRALTAVPCPFCGLTTATVALVHGEWAAAAKANPLAYLAAGVTIGTMPVMAARAFGRAAPPRPTSQRTRRYIAAGAITTGALSWLYQLHRCEIL